MNKPYNTAAFRAVATISQALAAKEAEAQAAQIHLADLSGRREALSARLADINGRRPAIEDGIDQELVDQLAADPAATPDPELMTKRVEAHGRAFDGWKADRAIVTQALGQIDAQLETAQASAETAVSPLNEARRTFVTAAHDALLDAFLDGFERLKSEFLVPMRMLAQIEIEGSKVIGYAHRRLASDTSVKVEQYIRHAPPAAVAAKPGETTLDPVAQSGGTQTVKVYEHARFSVEERQGSAAQVDAFRTALQDILPAKSK